MVTPYKICCVATEINFTNGTKERSSNTIPHLSNHKYLIMKEKKNITIFILLFLYRKVLNLLSIQTFKM